MTAVKARREYERLVKRLVRLREKASKARRRMIAGNRRHDEELTARKWTKKEKEALKKAMPAGMRREINRLQRSKRGRAALKAYELFWGLPFPPEIVIRKVKGKKRGRTPLVSLGRSPMLLLSAKRGARPKRVKWKRDLVYDPLTKRMMILNPRSTGARGLGLQLIGYAPETHYVPTRDMERTGTFKRGKYWVHQHSDDGGRWPGVFLDTNGNLFYGKGTYKVDRWLRR